MKWDWQPLSHRVFGEVAAALSDTVANDKSEQGEAGWSTRSAEGSLQQLSLLEAASHEMLWHRSERGGIPGAGWDLTLDPPSLYSSSSFSQMFSPVIVAAMPTSQLTNGILNWRNLFWKPQDGSTFMTHLAQDCIQTLLVTLSMDYLKLPKRTPAAYVWISPFLSSCCLSVWGIAVLTPRVLCSQQWMEAEQWLEPNWRHMENCLLLSELSDAPVHTLPRLMQVSCSTTSVCPDYCMTMGGKGVS